jgi:hypothetical protein
VTNPFAETNGQAFEERRGEAYAKLWTISSGFLKEGSTGDYARRGEEKKRSRREKKESSERKRRKDERRKRREKKAT